MKKIGWKLSFSELVVALGRARRRDVSNTILQRSLAELRRIRPAGDEGVSPSEIPLVNGAPVDGALLDGADSMTNAPAPPLPEPH